MCDLQHNSDSSSNMTVARNTRELLDLYSQCAWGAEGGNANIVIEGKHRWLNMQKRNWIVPSERNRQECF